MALKEVTHGHALALPRITHEPMARSLTFRLLERVHKRKPEAGGK